MESFKKINPESEIIKEIHKSFDLENIVIGTFNFGDDIPTLFVQFKSNNDLEANWKDFNNFITVEYLLKLKNEFSKWNTYLFYIVNQAIPKSVKYKIENNKFSTRKIVVECEDTEINSETIQQIISEYIVNDNIEFKVKKKEVEDFIKNSFINSAIEQSSIKELKKIKEENLVEVLSKLEIELKNED
ncbi:ABC-three component system middle component 1 [Aquimarina rhabdastrellae]